MSIPQIPIQALFRPRRDKKLSLKDEVEMFLRCLAKFNSPVPVVTDLLKKTSSSSRSPSAPTAALKALFSQSALLETLSECSKLASKDIGRGGACCDGPGCDVREQDRIRGPSGYQLRRCSKCLKRYYCSKTCFQADTDHLVMCEKADPRTIDKDGSFKRVRDIAINSFFRTFLVNVMYICQTLHYVIGEQRPYRARYIKFIFTSSFVPDPYDPTKDIPQLSKVEVIPHDVEDSVKVITHPDLTEESLADTYQPYFKDPSVQWMIQTDNPAAPHRIDLTRSISSHHLWKSLPPFAVNIFKEKILDKLEPEIEYLVLINMIIRENLLGAYDFRRDIPSRT